MTWLAPCCRRKPGCKGCCIFRPATPIWPNSFSAGASILAPSCCSTRRSAATNLPSACMSTNRDCTATSTLTPARRCNGWMASSSDAIWPCWNRGPARSVFWRGGEIWQKILLQFLTVLCTIQTKSDFSLPVPVPRCLRLRYWMWFFLLTWFFVWSWFATSVPIGA